MAYYDKISIVVPVYNVAAYLKDCIESICNSSYRNLEIILVDDGSTDRSGTICDEYAKLDNRVTVIHKENGGVSSARNAGLNAASGEYIGFVDSDDMVDSSMYATLYNDISGNRAQISICGCKTEYKNYTITHRKTNEVYVLDKRGAIKELLNEKRISSSVCNKLYARELFSEMRFDETITNGEDRLVNYYLMKCAERVVYRDRCLYTYRKREGSATTKPFSGKQFSRITVAKRIKADIEENMPQLKSYGVNCLVKALLSSYSQSIPYAEFEYERKEIRRILNEIWKYDRKAVNPTLKMALVMLRLHPAVYTIGSKMYKTIRNGKAKLIDREK